MASIGLKKPLLFLLGLLNGGRPFTGPFFVDVDITRRCNLRCLGCPYHDVKKEIEAVDRASDDISMDLVDRLAAELPKLGVQGVISAGTGEPLLHPHIVDIISRFNRAGLKTNLFTNGTLLDKERATGLTNAGLDRLTVSLWGSRPEEYEKCLPGSKSGAFHEIAENIRRLSGIKAALGTHSPGIYLHHVCSIHTYEHIRDKIELARETGCEGILFSPFNPHGGHAAPAALSDDQIADLIHAFSSLRGLMEKASLEHNIDSLLLQYRLGRRAWRKLPCYIAWYQTRVRVDGAVMSCCYCNSILGDLTKNSLSEIWNNRPYRNFRLQTGGRGDLAPLQGVCDCDWCCYLPQNYRVHRIFRWFGLLPGVR